MNTHAAKLLKAPARLVLLMLGWQLSLLAAHAQNLLVNGDFSAGTNGFTSGYTYVPSGQNTQTGSYGIRTSSQDFYSGYNAFSDHTTGSGNMMLVDGSTTAGVTVWQETVPVSANGNYTFSGWAAASDTENVPTLRMFINGVQTGSDFTLSSTPGNWKQFSATWNAGNNNTATISIVDLVTVSLGNDFALDDFSFSPQANVAMSTAFTYQGRLNSSGAPANGIYDITFSLFATNVNGTAIAGPVTNASVAVVNGLFTTTVNFGNAFNGGRDWLEMAVSPGGANTFTTLAPRQEITPTPYAQYAANATTAGTVTGPVSVSQLAGTVSTANLPATVNEYSGNVVLGSLAGTNITSTLGNNSGGDNVAIGEYALLLDTSGYYNTAVGYYSLDQNTSGSENTGLGAGALQNNTTANQNTAVGFQSLFSVTYNGKDTALGYHAGFSTYGGDNTAVGWSALAADAGGGQDTAVGSGSMLQTTGSGNTALGYNTLYQNVGGGGNTAIGESALTSGAGNNDSVAVGENALAYDYNGGNDNVAIGESSMPINGGNNNITIGAFSMNGTSVNNNTAIGAQALGNGSTFTGDQNIAVGYKAGYNLSSGANNIYIGNQGASSESGVIRIGDANVHNSTYLAGLVSGSFSGNYVGNGGGLTNLNAANITGALGPRTTVGSTPYTITVPGSYYLTANLTVSSGNAIVIAASGVTLDLDGFTISSTAATPSGAGIQINSGLQNITIMNGSILGGVTNDVSGNFGGTGFADGIYYPGGAQPVNVMVSHVSVSGCLNYGIFIGNNDSDLVEDCVVRTVGSYGIFASTVKTCLAINCGYTAIYGDQVSDCRAQSIDSGDGIDAWTANNCYATASSGIGIYANNVENSSGTTGGSAKGIYAATIMNSSGFSSGGNGIHALDNAENCNGTSAGSGYGVFATTVLNCNGLGSTGDAIHGNTAQNCYGSSGTGNGVSANLAQGCYGLTGSGNGVSANNAQNCYGQSTSGYGVYADNATACNGYSPNNTGIYANYSVQGCYGQTSDNNNSPAIYARNALNSTGSAKNGNGLTANQVENCAGYSGLNYGIVAASALNSYGFVTNSSVGLYAFAAMNCTGGSTTGTGIYATDAQNCFATAGHIGIAADTAVGCEGQGGNAGNGIGIDTLIAAFCHGAGATNIISNTGAVNY